MALDAAQRREQIRSLLIRTAEPVSASKIAAQMGVSRQIIVGDIALLRASDMDILSTARGYVLQKSIAPNQYIGKIVCQHNTIRQTRNELSIVVEAGGQVLDVIVEHPVYGEITGQLCIATHEDINQFLSRVENSGIHLLSELTGGIHLHSIACKDLSVFEAIKAELEQSGLLYREM